MVDLRERGLDVTRLILAVLDGSKSLRRAVLDVFDRPVLARRQLHKIRTCGTTCRNVRRGRVAAQALLYELARELDKPHPGAAGSLRKSLTETLTVWACLRRWRERCARRMRSSQ